MGIDTTVSSFPNVKHPGVVTARLLGNVDDTLFLVEIALFLVSTATVMVMNGCNSLVMNLSLGVRSWKRA